MKSSLFISAFLISSSLAAQIKVDYRAYQSSVKNQANRGTCTAFAICAALETFPGFPSDLSEQFVYAYAKAEYYKEMPDYDEGGYLKYYIDILQKHGTLSEEQAPYNPNAPVWNEKEGSFEKMKKDVSGSLLEILTIHGFYYRIQPEMYTYREESGARDVEWIKSMLDKGVKAIPVCYGVDADYWATHTGSRAHKIDPNDFLLVEMEEKVYPYAEALTKNVNTPEWILDGKLRFGYTDKTYAIEEGHAVAIVGYDESGFLIKNSWGTENWGDAGYGWVSFDYHRLLAKEALALHLGRVSVLEFANANKETPKKEAIYLKTLPRDSYNTFTKKAEKALDLSFVYHGNRSMPRMKQVEIKGFDSNEKLLGTWYGTCQGIFDGREKGYGTFILSAASVLYPMLPKASVRFTLDDGTVFVNTYHNLIAKNQEYKPATSRLDLLIEK